MTATTAAPFVFDPSDLGFIADPYPTYRLLREQAPVYRWEPARIWVVSRYHDVVTVLRDRRFSLDDSHWEFASPPPAGAQPTAYQALMKNSLFRLPEVDHQRIRRLVAPAMSPRTLVGLQRDVDAIVGDVLDRLAGRDDVDIAREFSERIPLRVIGRMLQIPERHEETFRRFGLALIDSISVALSPDEFAATIAPIPAGLDMLNEVIEERRRDHEPGLLTAWIEAEEAGERLTRDELVALAGSMITAGTDTAVQLVSFAVLDLLRHPDQLARLRADPGLVRGAVDEVLRFDHFGKGGVPRFPLEDLELGGRQIRRGEMVIGLVGSALRDPDVFPDPDRFDIGRSQAQSIAFGSGPHFCAGASLGRMMSQTAVLSLVTRYPELALAGPPTFESHAFLRKLSHLPVRLGPAA
ncbi:Cytochrome P450 [Nannocystis exedens]|uniref:Cytochrome P450 n=1 Tax=Nannocystis exedens TaxID=54 RepID=A0A1I2DZU5_9BACT|nr:cytochrome P450 [Nannocystis exedens]PCC69169.1 cytochrome P450 [Nannocystis exedens]SFE85811.1 Cytochrome P450 [Nannocystis exedens]